jgi:hypothetical protein
MFLALQASFQYLLKDNKICWQILKSVSYQRSCVLLLLEMIISCRVLPYKAVKVLRVHREQQATITHVMSRTKDLISPNG